MAILPVRPKKSTIYGKVPTSSQLELGELAINIAKGSERLYTRNSNNEIVELFRSELNGSVNFSTLLTSSTTGLKWYRLCTMGRKSGFGSLNISVDSDSFVSLNFGYLKSSPLNVNPIVKIQSEIAATSFDVSGVGFVVSGDEVHIEVLLSIKSGSRLYNVSMYGLPYGFSCNKVLTESTVPDGDTSRVVVDIN